MNEGAIILMDCLGYKGIWQRANPDAVLQQFGAIRDRALRVRDEGIFHAHRMLGFQLQITFLSDTVAIGVSAPGVPQLSSRDKGRIIQHAFLAAQKISSDFLNMTPPLAVRGAASFGQFELSDQFLIGPAVDEAAELHEMADGAFLWIPPQYIAFITEMREATTQQLRQNEGIENIVDLVVAVWQSFGGPIDAQTLRARLTALPPARLSEINQLFRDMLGDPDNDCNLVPYTVPLKGRSGLECLVAGPNLPNTRYSVLRAKYELAMTGTSLDVLIKRQNTLRFLDYAHAKHVRSQEKWAERTRALDRDLGITWE